MTRATTNSTPPRLVLLPGLGADARFLHYQRAAFPQMIVPAWLDPEPRESLQHYAERLAGTVRADGPVVVGGVSLGGMLALEMARYLDTKGVVLISSCRHPTAVTWLLRTAEPCSRLLPNALLQFSHHFGPLVLGRGGELPADDKRLLVQMVKDLPVKFIRWGARAVLEWPGAADLPMPVRHIHGENDWVIPTRGVKPDRVVPRGAHVLNMTHPREVNEFLRECLAKEETPNAEVHRGNAEVRRAAS